MRVTGADRSPCRTTCSIRARRPRPTGDGGTARRRRGCDTGGVADRIDVSATETTGARRGRVGRGGHRHRHPRSAAGRGGLRATRHGRGRRAAQVRCRTARSLTCQGSRRGHATPSGDDGHADSAHGRTHRLWRSGDVDIARAAPRSAADRDQHDFHHGETTMAQPCVAADRRGSACGTAGLCRRASHRRDR